MRASAARCSTRWSVGKSGCRGPGTIVTMTGNVLRPPSGAATHTHPRSSPFIGSVRLIHIPANRSRSARRSGSLMPSASDKHSHALARYPDDRYCVRRSPSSASLTQYWDKFSIDALVWVLGVASANFRQSQATRLYSSAVLMGCVSPFAHEPRVSLGATAHEPRPFRLGIENCIPADTSKIDMRHNVDTLG